MDVPDSDLMATNGVIHVVKNVLYPGGKSCIHYYTFMQCTLCVGIHFPLICILLTDLPVGSQDLMFILKKLIKYIQIKVWREKTLICMNMCRAKTICLVCLLNHINLLFWYVFLFCSLFLDLLTPRSHSPSSVSFHNVTIAV